MIFVNLFDVLKDDLIEMNHDHNHEYDEHIWFSIKNAIKVCNYLYEKICLSDVKYQNAINNSQVKTIVFADQFPFMYLARNYNLYYFAAFTGCNAEKDFHLLVMDYLIYYLE